MATVPDEAAVREPTRPRPRASVDGAPAPARAGSRPSVSRPSARGSAPGTGTRWGPQVGPRSHARASAPRGVAPPPRAPATRTPGRLLAHVVATRVGPEGSRF